MDGTRGSDSTETVSGHPDGRRRQRGLGPFTSGHLTAIIVAVVLVVGFPVATFAITGSNVFVTDHSTGATAKVDAAGQLQTHPNGTQNVSGAVTARPQSPNQLFHTTPHAFTSNGANCGLVVNSDDPYPNGGGGTAAMVITEIHLTTRGNVGDLVQLHRFSNCSDAALTILAIPTTNTYANVDMTFPSGLVIPTDGKLYAAAYNGATLFASAYGYLVPTAAVPSNG